MAIDFPGSPALDQEFTSAGVTWKWDGQKWVSQATGGGGGTGMPTGGGTPPEDAFYLNTTTIDENFEITEGKNAGTFGPVTVNGDITVPDGSTWTVVGGGEGGGGGGGGATGVRYQQGNWTPAFSNGTPQTETSFQPDWYRIGQWVTVNARIQWTGNTVNEAIVVVGLPYPNTEDYLEGSNYVGAVMAQQQKDSITGTNGQANNLVCYPINIADDDGITFYWQSGSSTFTKINWTDFNATATDCQLIFSVTYKTDDTTFVPINGATKTTDIQGGGGSGGGSGTGADAWAFVERTTANGPCAFPASFNIQSVTRYDEGRYSVVFTTPMPSNNYGISVSSEADVGFIPNATYFNVSTTGFDVAIYDEFTADTFCDAGFSIQVFAANTIAPQAGVGADAWADCAADGTFSSNFNIASITKDDVGIYDVVFTTPMPTANYSVVGSTENISDNLAPITFQYLHQNTQGFRVALKYWDVNKDEAEYWDNPFTFAVYASSTITPTFTWTRDGTDLKPANDGDSLSFNNGATTLTSSGYWKINRAPGFAAYQAVNSSTDQIVVDIKCDGSANFSGNVTAPNVTFSLDPDNFDNYTNTTNAEGETESVYNGPTLDVKALLLEFQSKIETLEAAKAALEARITTLEGGAN
jgi:hypothetical protein